MTSPIFRTRTLGEEITQGLSPLFAALQQRQEMEFAQQQLQTQQAVAQSNIEQTKAQTEALRLQSETRRVEAEGEAAAAKELQTMLDTTGGQITQQAIAGALARLKTPQAIMAFTRSIPGLGEALSAPAAVRRGEAEADITTADATAAPARAAASAASAQLTQQIVGAARTFLSDPNASLPTDPTRQEAVALAGLDLLGLIDSQMRSRAMRADSDSQSRMLARQAAIGVMQESFRQFREAQQTAVTDEDRAALPTLDSIIDANAQSALGIPGTEVRRIVGTAMSELVGPRTPAQQAQFLREQETSLNNQGLLSPRQMSTLDALEGRLTGFTQEQRNDLVQTALALLRGGTAPTVEALRSAGFERPAQTRALILNMVQRFRGR